MKIPESGTYRTFKKAVLEHCFPIPELGSIWQAPAGQCLVTPVMVDGWEWHSGCVFLILHKLRHEEDRWRMSQQEWAEHGWKPDKWDRRAGTLFDILFGTEYRIFGTETGRLTYIRNIQSIPKS